MAFNSEYGPSYLNLISGDYFRASLNDNDSLFKLLRTDLAIRTTAADSYLELPRFKRYIAIFEWLISLRFLQAIVNRIFLRKADLNPKKSFFYPLRRGLHALFTLPLSIINYTVHWVFAPLQSLRTLFRSKAKAASLAESLKIKQVIGNSGFSIRLFQNQGEALNKDLINKLSSNSRAEICTAIIEEGDWKGCTALTMAISLRDTATATALVQGLPIDTRTEICTTIIEQKDSWMDGHTALTLAIYIGDTATASALIEDLSIDSLTKICTTIRKGFTALTLAINKGDTTTATALIKRLPSETLTNIFTTIIKNGYGKGQTTLTLAIPLEVQNRHSTTATALVKCLSIETRTKICTTIIEEGIWKGHTALTMAITEANTATASALIEDLSSDTLAKICTTIIEEGYWKGCTALTAAMIRKNTAIVSALVQALPDETRATICTTIIKGGNRKGHTALTMAILSDDTATATALIKDLSIDTRAKICTTIIEYGERKGLTALTLAILNGNTTIATTLLKALSVDVRAKLCNTVITEGYWSGYTALTMAILIDDTATATALVKGLPDDTRSEICTTIIEEYNGKDHTVLTLAILKGHTATANALLQGLTDAELTKLMATEITMYNNHTTTIQAYIALYNGFRDDTADEQGQFDAYAENHELEVNEICLNAFNDTYEQVKYGNRSRTKGFTIALQNQVSHTCLKSKERKEFLLSAEKPLALALKECDYKLINEVLDAARDWLDGTFGINPRSAEKLRALTPAGDLPGAENSLIVHAFENGRIELVEWLLAQGVTLPPRLRVQADARGIQYGQSIHNPAVHQTVDDSLQAISKQQPLSQAEMDAAIAALRLHVGKPDTTDITNFEAVAKRAILRITEPAFLIHQENRSKVSVEQILTYFWQGYEKIKDKDPIKEKAAKEEALGKFYSFLNTIQRDYNMDSKDVDNKSADRSICIPGTLNNLTMALQAVRPDIIWVVYEDNKTLALKGLNAVFELIKTEFANAKDKAAFAELCNQENSLGLIPKAIWSRIETKLYEELQTKLYNYDIVPPRYSVIPAAQERFIKDAMKIIQSGSISKQFTSEMQTPADRISELLGQISETEKMAQTTTAAPSPATGTKVVTMYGELSTQSGAVADTVTGQPKNDTQQDQPQVNATNLRPRGSQS